MFTTVLEACDFEVQVIVLRSAFSLAHSSYLSVKNMSYDVALVLQVIEKDDKG